MNHYTAPEFWELYNNLPKRIQDLVQKNYVLLQTDPSHPSLNFKRAGPYWTVRIGIHYRAIGLPEDDGVLWFWIGSHAEYDRILKNI